FVFYPTEQAEERTPAGYARLLGRLSQGLRSLDERQVRSRRGPQLLRQVYEEAAEQVAREHEGDVASHSLQGRVAQTSQTLRREGIVDAWTKGSDGYHLTNSACPYRQVALGSQGPCELDRRAIELLIEAPVRQVSRIADGHAACEYVVADVRKGSKQKAR
ncbi:MAG: hypothetical protein U1B78_03775, partial [Dehalococcoidia bacterium]|nr:hypothetical protein [Dehalococcoidia bacterium]